MNYTKGEWKITKCSIQEYGDPIQHIFITSDSGKFKGRTLADIGFWRDFPEEMVEANAHLIATAVNGCASVNPNNPTAVAQNIKDMYEALKELVEEYNVDLEFCKFNDVPHWESACKVLAKVESIEL